MRALGRRTTLVFVLGMIGAAMFLGDSFITPAISVLSAVEGLKLAAPTLEHYVIPITIVILVGLFSVQSHGTARVATFFGPITVTWFVAIAVFGAMHIFDDPHVLHAINPYYALHFLFTNGTVALVTLGLVFLAVTGGEALYADLGHFGRKPIRLAWFGLVMPALLINYFGQGALVLANPAAIENSFYRLVPDVLLIPMVVLATAATVIASQAVITGAYSLVQQAIQLGFLPRFAIVHTSEDQYGQIYMPRVNAILLIGVVLLVLMFRSSSALASAYGIAVATTMVVDGMLGFIVIWALWKWKWWQAALLIIPFVLIDSTFLAANLLKLFDGAWVPLLFAGVMVLVMWTWRRGTRILANKTRRTEVPLDTLVRSLEKKPPHHVPGTAVFLTSDPSSAPTALMHNLKHNKILHEHNVILTIVTVRYAAGARGGSRGDVADQPAFQHGDAEFRLHGTAERPARARDRAQAGLDLRHHVDVVFPVAPLAQALARIPACRSGRTACSSVSPKARATPPTSSRFRPAGWWKSEPR